MKNFSKLCGILIFLIFIVGNGFASGQECVSTLMFQMKLEQLKIDKDSRGFFLTMKKAYPDTAWIKVSPSWYTGSISSDFFLDRWVKLGEQFSSNKPYALITSEFYIDNDFQQQPITFTLEKPIKLSEDTWRFDIKPKTQNLKPRVIDNAIIFIYIFKNYEDTRHLPFLELVN